jgi:truncated hemoglobin YjbI
MKSAVDEIEAEQSLKDELWSYLEGAAQFLVNQPN